MTNIKARIFGEKSVLFIHLIRIALVIAGSALVFGSIATLVPRPWDVTALIQISVMFGLCLIGESFVLGSNNLTIRYTLSLVLTMVLLFLWFSVLFPANAYNVNLLRPPALGHSAFMFASLSTAFIAFAFLTFYTAAVIIKSPHLAKNFVFSHILAVMLIIFLGAGLEGISAMLAPGWPAREIRPVVPSGQGYNSWGLRDSPRTVQKPEGAKRVLFIGDSFLETGFYNFTVPSIVENKLSDYGENVECINLGVSATGPNQYLYRFRNVGSKLSPDAVVLFIYAGNDFIGTHYNQSLKLIDERPLPSVMGTIMPRFTWIVVDRFSLSEFGHNSKPIPNEFEDLKRMSQMPYDDGVSALSEHMYRYYFPQLTVSQIEAILRKGGPALWQELAPRDEDQQYLQGWKVQQIIQLSLAADQNRGAARQANNEIVDATASYIEQMRNDTRRLDIPLFVVLIPIAEEVDPEYQQFWQPWYQADDVVSMLGNRDNRLALSEDLKINGVSVIDLTDVLNGIPGTYRKFDGHWTKKGQELVAKEITKVVVNLVGN